MIEKFEAREAELLHRHLKAIVSVETTTVPLYLTAVYSFTRRAINWSPDGGKSWPLYDLQQNLLSVAVQEMYHLQLACNLANAFAVTPDIPELRLEPGKPIRIRHLEEDGKAIVARLGAVPDVIDALIDLERPSPEPYPEPNEKVRYPSIAALYAATLDLLSGYMRAFGPTPTTRDPHFKPNNKQIAYGTFASTYKYNLIKDRRQVAKVASAITDQGEGNVVGARTGGAFSSGEHDDVLPEYRPKAGTRFSAYGKETHFKRLEDIKAALTTKDWEVVIGGPVFYSGDGEKTGDVPSWAASEPALREATATIWSYLVDVMQRGFATGDLPMHSAASPEGNAIPAFGDVMIAFKYLMPQAWQYGMVPGFEYKKGVSPADAQKAMDTVDPLCLFHWDARSAAVRAAGDFNACQGLNACAGKGWGGTGTTPGDAACATADLHSCGGGNSCKAQGGCGYLSTDTSGDGDLLPPSEQWIPGENSCKNQGGCQTPIAPEQVFDRGAGAQIESQDGLDWTAEAKAGLTALVGTGVWDRARQVLAKEQGKSTLPEPRSPTVDGLHYEGTSRRGTVSPTSK